MALILIIDDSSFQRGIIRQVLERADCETLEAADGQEGLEKITVHQPDCILTDLLMPTMGGLELLESLHEQGTTIPVIIITSNVQESVRQRCLELGADGVVSKPIDREKLISAITKALEGGATGL